MAAARHHVLQAAGWDVERDGLQGAPRVRVVAGAERHATIDRSLRLLGLGSAAVEEVAAGPNGAIDVGELSRVLAAGPAGPTVLCLQAGNVNTGACDDLRVAVPLGREHGAWVHVDGGRRAGPRPPRRRRGGGRLVGRRRPQVAQRPVRLRVRDLRPPGRAGRGDELLGELPHGVGRPGPHAG
jgi:hypothetical protein